MRIAKEEDDSTSMKDPNEKGTRAHNQAHLVKKMAQLCTRIVPDNQGVDLFYIHDDGVLNKRESEIEEYMKKVRSKRGTPIGTKLQDKILDPFVYSVLQGSNKQFQRPLFITIITDGLPEGEADDDQKALEKAVLKCIGKLKENGYPEYGRHQPQQDHRVLCLTSLAVVFQISQIGDNRAARNFLMELRKQRDKQGLKSLYCTSGKPPVTVLPRSSCSTYNHNYRISRQRLEEGREYGRRNIAY